MSGLQGCVGLAGTALCVRCLKKYGSDSCITWRLKYRQKVKRGLKAPKEFTKWNR